MQEVLNLFRWVILLYAAYFVVFTAVALVIVYFVIRSFINFQRKFDAL